MMVRKVAGDVIPMATIHEDAMPHTAFTHADTNGSGPPSPIATALPNKHIIHAGAGMVIVQQYEKDHIDFLRDNRAHIAALIKFSDTFAKQKKQQFHDAHFPVQSDADTVRRDFIETFAKKKILQLKLESFKVDDQTVQKDLGTHYDVRGSLQDISRKIEASAAAFNGKKKKAVAAYRDVAIDFLANMTQATATMVSACIAIQTNHTEIARETGELEHLVSELGTEVAKMASPKNVDIPDVILAAPSQTKKYKESDDYVADLRQINISGRQQVRQLKQSIDDIRTNITHGEALKKKIADVKEKTDQCRAENAALEQQLLQVRVHYDAFQANEVKSATTNGRLRRDIYKTLSAKLVKDLAESAAGQKTDDPSLQTILKKIDRQKETYVRFEDKAAKESSAFADLDQTYNGMLDKVMATVS